MRQATVHSIEAIAMGGSAGAIDALGELLPALPADFALPLVLVLVLHLPPAAPNRIPELLRAKCAGLRIKEAEDKEPLEPGTLYVAPPGYHLLIERRRCFSLSVDEPVHFSRPSIDVLFESAADAYGPALVGVLLAGGSEDGARGLAQICAAGGSALVQSPETAAAPTMPRAALQLGIPLQTLPPGEIGARLARLQSPSAARDGAP
jgi:two-component system chemotaxis response regulator CheB